MVTLILPMVYAGTWTAIHCTAVQWPPHWSVVYITAWWSLWYCQWYMLGRGQQLAVQLFQWPPHWCVVYITAWWSLWYYQWYMLGCGQQLTVQLFRWPPHWYIVYIPAWWSLWYCQWYMLGRAQQLLYSCLSDHHTLICCLHYSLMVTLIQSTVYAGTLTATHCTVVPVTTTSSTGRLPQQKLNSKSFLPYYVELFCSSVTKIPIELKLKNAWEINLSHRESANQYLPVTFEI